MNRPTFLMEMIFLSMPPHLQLEDEISLASYFYYPLLTIGALYHSPSERQRDRSHCHNIPTRTATKDDPLLPPAAPPVFVSQTISEVHI